MAAVEQLMLMVRQSSASAGLRREDIRGLVYHLVDVIIQPDKVLLAGLAGAGSALGIPAFVAFALLPPKPLHGDARLARCGEIARAKLYRAGATRSSSVGIAASCSPSTPTCIRSSRRAPAPASFIHIGRGGFVVSNQAHDPYWDNVARYLMVGLILLVLEAGPAKGWPVSIGPPSQQAAPAAALQRGIRRVSQEENRRSAEGNVAANYPASLTGS